MNGDDRGMALVETVLLALVLIVPLLWLLGMLDHVHRAALGATTAAREAGFALAAAPDSSAQDLRGVVALGLRGQGLDPERAGVDISRADGTERGGTVRVQVRYRVPMLDIPVLADLPGVWVRATHDVVIDRYRSR